MDARTILGWLKDWEAAWAVPGLAGRVQIKFSYRLTRSLGRCYPESGRIHLNARLLDCDPNLQREVVCHEAAHVAVSMLHGRKARPHGSEWKTLQQLAQFKPRVRYEPASLPAALTAHNRPRWLYRHQCLVCGTSRTAGRPVRRWRCRACLEDGLEGRLEITTRPAAGSPRP